MDEICLERPRGGLLHVRKIGHHRTTRGLCQVSGEYLGETP
jgi:hypothetical protein